MPRLISRRRLLLLLVLAAVPSAAAGIFYLVRPSSSANSGGTIFVEPARVIVEAKGSSGTEKLQAEFQLVNSGKRVIRLGEIKALCPCTIPSPLATNVLNPGERVTLVVNATPPAYGSTDATITVATDDPGTPLLQLSLALKGHEPEAPFVTYVSGDVRLVGTKPGQVLNQTLEVRTVEIVGSTPWLLADQQLTPELTIVMLEPPTDSRLSDTTLHRTVAITGNNVGERFQVSIESVSADWLEVDVPDQATDLSGVAARLRVRLKSVPPPTTDPSHLQRAIVRLKGNDPDETVIELPVNVQVR